MNAKKDDVSLRRHLGIPGDAEHVLILAESSHWDPNWLLTSEEYFRRFVRRNLDFAVEQLLAVVMRLRIRKMSCLRSLRLS